MRQALIEAQHAFAKDEVPVGIRKDLIEIIEEGLEKTPDTLD